MVGSPRVQRASTHRVRSDGVEDRIRKREGTSRRGVGWHARRGCEECRRHRGPRSVDPSAAPAYTPAHPMTRPRALDAAAVPRPLTVVKRVAVACAFLSLLAGAPVAGQVPGADAGRGTRFGLSFGGISTVSVTVEVFRDARSVEASIGTWSFRDLSLSVVGRQYFGAARARPVVGAGLWLVGQPARPGEPRSSWALVLRAPVGVDTGFADRHALGLFVNVDRGLWVRRGDPADDTPVQSRLVPLPELYYRVTR